MFRVIAIVKKNKTVIVDVHTLTWKVNEEEKWKITFDVIIYHQLAKKIAV